MESFKYNEQNIDFLKVTGKVLEDKKHSETHVSSDGGGGYVGQHGGYVSAAQVSSTAVTKQEIWIKTDSGHEHNLQLTGYDIPLRAGHEVSVLYANSQKATDQCRTAFINHTTNKYWFLTNTDNLISNLDLDSNSSFLGIIKRLVFVFGIAMILGIVFNPSSSSWWWSLFTAWGVVIYWFSRTNTSKEKGRKDSFHTHLVRQIQQVIKEQRS